MTAEPIVVAVVGTGDTISTSIVAPQVRNGAHAPLLEMNGTDAGHPPERTRSAPNDPLAGMTRKQVWHDCVWLSEHHDDTTSAKLMLLCIGRFFDENARSSSMSYAQIARECRFEERSSKRLARTLVGRWLSVTVGGGFYVPGKGRQNLYSGICPPDLVERLREQRRDGKPIMRDDRLEKAVNNVVDRIKNGVTSGHPENGDGVTHNHPEPASGVTSGHPEGERGDSGAPSGCPQVTRTPTTPKERQEAASSEVDEALAAYNSAAELHGFSPCRTLTDARRKRLQKRLDDIEGVDAFKVALTALPSNDFLMGRTRPRPGQKPFKLDIDALMQTEGNLGDVLARLIDAAEDAPTRNCTFEEEVQALREKHPEIPVEQLEQAVTDSRRARGLD